jgi:hypothetical protein
MDAHNGCFGPKTIQAIAEHKQRKHHKTDLERFEQELRLQRLREQYHG